MQNNNNSRRDFLKKISVAFGSIVILSSFGTKKTKGNDMEQNKASKEDFNVSSISESNAHDLIKNGKRLSDIRIKPEPAPIHNQNK